MFKIILKVFSYNKRHWLARKWGRIYAKFLKYEFRRFGENNSIDGFADLVGSDCISIGSNCKIQKECFLTAWKSFGNKKFMPEIIIGNNVSLGAYNHISAINSIKIGNGVLTGKWVTIVDNSHGDTNLKSLYKSPSKRPMVSKRKALIGDDVWIGDKVTILPNVEIGKGAVIAANSVVTKNVKSYTVVGGNPATIIKSNMQ